ncbi:MAG: 30S ribosomal protein S18 [Acidobacteria bacterium]|nr:30S ribosomal protein S18 [Acidobacteriota bacterium]
MGRKSKATAPPRNDRKGRDNGKKFKKKVCVFCKEGATWIDYKDVNLLRRFMSDRAKIRARRVSGNCAQHQRDIAEAIKTSRELALLPYAVKVTSSRGGGRGGGGRGGDRGDRGDRGPRGDREATPAEGGEDVVAATGRDGDEPILVSAGDDGGAGESE